VVKRLNTMTAGIKTAMTGPNKAKVQTLFVGANAAIKNHDYDAADKSLDELEPLIAETSSESPKPTPTAPDGAAVMKRLNAMSADIKTAMAGPNKTAVQTRFVSVNAAIKNHDYAGASKTLDELEGLLQGPKLSGDGAPSGTGGKLSLVKLGKARIEWDQLRTKAVTDIGTLQQKLQEEYKDDADQSSQLAAAVKTLGGLVTQLNAELGAKLDDVLNAQDEGKRKPFIDGAKATMTKFIQFVQGDKIMMALDGNEIMPEMHVVAPLQGKLKEIASALG
jgi:uncharacterized protein YqeY